jgi:transposase InsO family protein
MELSKRGFVVNHKVVMRLMKEEHLTCLVRMKKYRSYRGEVGRIAPNVIQGDFRANAPYEKLTTDITEFALFGTKLYLSPLLDMYNGEILSYVISEKPVLKQVLDMLRQGFTVVPADARPILHSDQGWQYQHKMYQQMLTDEGWTRSMSRKGNCLDNAVMENFFGLLKSELLYLHSFESLEDFRQQLEEYIDYYNHRRIKGKLKGMSPVEYRTHSFKAA